MKAPWCVCLLAAAVAAGLSLAPAQQDVESVPLDWSLELHPDNTSTTRDITGILWKHGPSKVAEWDESYGPHGVEYYGTYKGRAELNSHTGRLVVRHVTADDGGGYSVEVNGRPQGKTYEVEVIQYLPWDAVLELRPDAIISVAENITGVLWRHGPRKVAEWDADRGPDVDYHGTYKERAELNKATGTLVVKNMTAEDSGVYAVEVNNGRLLRSKTYRVEVVKKVPKPVVAVQPLACSPYYSGCTLGCRGDVANGSGSVTYRWVWREEDDDGGTWMASDSEEQPVRWYIRNNRRGRRVQEYFCEMKNPVSVERSDAFRNPFVHKGTTVMAVVIVIGRVSVGLAISFMLMALTACLVICNHGSRRVAHVGAATTEHTA